MKNNREMEGPKYNNNNNNKEKEEKKIKERACRM